MRSAFDLIDAKFKPKPTLSCVRCESTEGVKLEDSRTMYHFDGKIGSEDDPNRPIPLCRECAAEHHEHWDSMWADYYSDKL